MKITHVEQFVTAVPHIPAIQKTRPTDYTDRPIALVKVHTDEEIYGLGEGGRGQRFDDAMEGWIGQDPMALTWSTLGGAFGMAVYDIVGKALELPAHRLMGTRHWDKVPVGWWSSPMEPVDMVPMSPRDMPSPSFMIEPLPNCRSIWVIVTLRDFSLSSDFTTLSTGPFALPLGAIPRPPFRHRSRPNVSRIV